MFETLQPAPPDAILGLTEAFRNDSNPDKINLGVGVYQDANGTTPILDCVKEAEQRLLQDESTKSYLPINGSPQYGEQVRRLLFGDGHEVLLDGRAVTGHCPGGTGAVRVAADFIKTSFPDATIWMSKPTWANHPNIFDAAGLPQNHYAYFDKENNCLDFDAMIADLNKIPAGDAVLLHGACHNPSGIDPTVEQWKKIADVIYDRSLLPLVDFAYQGFADGLREDAAGVLEMCRPGCNLLIASSFSKNFGLYRERVGALTAVCSSSETAEVILSHLKKTARANYSNPPAHGAAIVATVLGDQSLYGAWEEEVAVMRDRINGMRRLFVETMKTKTPQRDFSFITAQRGMFSFSGLTPLQVDELKNRYSIYIVRSGRINVAGMTEANIEYLCDAVASVL